MNDKPENRRRTRTAALALFALALFFRLAGLSHDLHLGKIYHPDTPKQVWAAQRFLTGSFYSEVGHPDYDGYPAFNSLLAAGMYRVVAATSRLLTDHIGVEPLVPAPDSSALFWITRLLNALFSAVAVSLLYCLGRRVYDQATAGTAAALLAISPIDVVTCHYASSDTAAAFFSLLAVVFSLSVYRNGRFRDYVLAAMFAMCSFSAKYHGALSFLPIALAHVFRARSVRDLFTRASLLRVAVTVAATVIAFFLTTPAAISEPVKTLGHILGFMRYTSNFHLPQEIAEQSFAGRFVFSAQKHIPVFVDILSPVLSVGAVVALVGCIMRRHREEWIVASVPVSYLIVALTLKPVSHTVYHTMVTPALFLLGTAGLFVLIRQQRRQPWARVVAILLLIVAAAHLLSRTQRELFYFSHEDTRLIAEQWAAENIPRSFQVVGGSYTTIADWGQEHPERNRGLAWVRSDPREQIEDGDPCIARFDIEDDQMLFRNFDTDIHLAKHAWIRPNFESPVFQRIPAESPHRLAPLQPEPLLRSTHIMKVQDRVPRTFLSDGRIDKALIVVQSVSHPVTVETRFARHSHEWKLGHGKAAWKTINAPQPGWPRLGSKFHYAFEATCSGGDVVIALGLTPLERGLLFYELGEYELAHAELRASAHLDTNPTVRALAFVSAVRSGQRADATELQALGELASEVPLTAEDTLRIYGLSPDYLVDLPYIALGPGDLPESLDFRSAYDAGVPGDHVFYPNDTGNVLRRLLTHPLYLQSGCYRLQLRLKPLNKAPLPEQVIVRFHDAAGAEKLFESTVPIDNSPGSEWLTLSVPFEKDAAPAHLQIEFIFPPRPDGEQSTGHTPTVTIRDIRIHPDPVATLNRLRDVLQSLSQPGEKQT